MHSWIKGSKVCIILSIESRQFSWVTKMVVSLKMKKNRICFFNCMLHTITYIIYIYWSFGRLDVVLYVYFQTQICMFVLWFLIEIYRIGNHTTSPDFIFPKNLNQFWIRGGWVVVGIRHLSLPICFYNIICLWFIWIFWMKSSTILYLIRFLNNAPAPHASIPFSGNFERT